MDGDVLDVGCGEGRFISLAPDRIRGIDHNPQSVSSCIKKGYRVTHSVVTKLDVPDQSVSNVHSSHVIEHLEPAAAHMLLSEMHRVLKPGGILVIRSPLPHKYFYNSFTHVKPYPPSAILHYLVTKPQKQRTLDVIGRYEFVALRYRRRPLFFSFKNRYLWALGNILFRVGIKSPMRTGYMLVLRKVLRSTF